MCAVFFFYFTRCLSWCAYDALCNFGIDNRQISNVHTPLKNSLACMQSSFRWQFIYLTLGIYKKIILISLFVHYIWKVISMLCLHQKIPKCCLSFKETHTKKEEKNCRNKKEIEKKTKDTHRMKRKKIKCAQEIIKTSHKLRKTIMFQAKCRASTVNADYK